MASKDERSITNKNVDTRICDEDHNTMESVLYLLLGLELGQSYGIIVAQVRDVAQGFCNVNYD